MNQLSLNIGRNLHRIRKQRGLSLDKAAEITGVSKGMLGQIERGESNPTVTTLWKIAGGLKVSFTAFMAEETPAVALVRRQESKPLIAAAGNYQVFPLFLFDRQKCFEIFNVELAPGCVHQAEAHNPGVEEYVLVSIGTLEISLEEEIYRVKAGDAIRFPGDRPHTYCNNTGDLARAVNIIYYSQD